jgi:putative endonuclease
VYLVRCADGTLYCGVTTDVARRVAQHNAGTASKYTRSRRPVELVFREPARAVGPALRREREIKSLSRAHKQRLIGTRPLQPGGRRG